MLAVVLAAGNGARMAPLTPERPKALLPTLDAPQLSWVLAMLGQAGLERAWVNGHTGADQITGALARERQRRPLSIEFSHETQEPLGTAGALRALATELTEPFIVANADLACDLPLERLIQAHASARAPATVLAIPVEDEADFMVEESWAVDLIDRREQVRSGHRYGGIAVFDPEVLELIPPGPQGLYETVMTGLIRQHRGLAALQWDGYWRDIAAPRDHLQANLDVLAGMRDPKLVAGAAGDACERWDVLAFVGEGARVEDAELRQTIVVSGAVVPPGSRLERCVVWDGARVPRGIYRETIITPTRVIPVT
jgi:NDP-sugar pyrophosphorylase family protein